MQSTAAPVARRSPTAQRRGVSADLLGKFEAGWTGPHDERWQIARQAVVDRMNGHADETPWPAHDEAPNDRPPREPDDCDEPTPIREVCATEPAVAAPDDWPDPPAAAALYGLPGRVVEFVNPFSEADPVAVLGTFLTVFGCALNTSPHAMVGPERHPARLFLALVGRSSV